jgi:hypothetical protein
LKIFSGVFIHPFFVQKPYPHNFELKQAQIFISKVKNLPYIEIERKNFPGTDLQPVFPYDRKDPAIHEKGNYS